MENCSGNKRSRIFIIIIFIIAMAGQRQKAFGQSNNRKIKISRPEFVWAIAHPFKANKALNISKLAIYITDSIEQDSILNDRSGGQLDAFKHGIWMALLNREIGKKASIKLGIAHEKANYRNFKKGRSYSTHMHSVMDSLNNLISIRTNEKIENSDSLIQKVINEVKSGNYYILKKNKSGQYIDCQGNIINDKIRIWERNECLIKSNFQEL